MMQISDERSPAARRKALSRVKSVMLCSLRKYIQTVTDLMTKASPRKKSLFNSMKKLCGAKDWAGGPQKIAVIQIVCVWW